MFTGIIEEIGHLEAIERGSQSAVLHIGCEKVLEGTQAGDSIAVNGVCLTVTSLGKKGYTADVMAETLDRSSLGDLKRGSRVNLERAMAADGRFGGHIVAGHIDGTGIIQSVTRDETAVWYKIQAGADILRYVVEKGSITIDGISLTVNDCGPDFLEVNVIPETWRATTVAEWAPGTRINMETDVIGKYVRHMVAPHLGLASEEAKAGKLSVEFLRENGFF